MLEWVASMVVVKRSNQPRWPSRTANGKRPPRGRPNLYLPLCSQRRCARVKQFEPDREEGDGAEVAGQTERDRHHRFGRSEFDATLFEKGRVGDGERGAGVDDAEVSAGAAGRGEQDGGADDSGLVGQRRFVEVLVRVSPLRGRRCVSQGRRRSGRRGWGRGG